MQRCIDQNRVREWVLESMPHPEQAGPLVAIGYEIGSELVAGFILENYDPENRSVEFHTRLLKPKNNSGFFYKAVLADFAYYLFAELGCQRISVYIPEQKRRATKILQLCGFKNEGRLRRAMGGQDVMLYALLDDEAPAWLFTPGAPARSMEPKPGGF